MPIGRFKLKIPGSPRTWILLAAILMCLSIFIQVAGEVVESRTDLDDDIRSFDQAVYSFVISFKNDMLTQVFIDITALGSIAVLTLFTAIGVLYLMGSRDYVGVAHVSIAMLGAIGWPTLLKGIFARSRPDIAQHLVRVGELSFPSGHAFGSAVAYFTFAFFAARYIKSVKYETICFIIAGLLVFLVALSRVYLGVHYASDVVAGISAGVAWSCLVAGVFIYRYRKTSS